MAKKHFTALGEPIDMAALAAKHATIPALGNANMNARGDIVGNGGMVLRTQEQIEEEWRKAREANQASIGGMSRNIKSPLPGTAPEKKIMADQDFDPVVADLSVPDDPVQETNTASPPPTPRRRKMVDSE